MKLVLFAVFVVLLSLVLAVFFPEYLKYLGIVVLFLLLANKNAVERRNQPNEFTLVGNFWNIGTLLGAILLSAYVGLDLGLSWRGIAFVVFLAIMVFTMAVEKMEEV